VATRGRRERPRATRTRARVLLSPLADRDYRLIWLAQLASTAGDWATRLALAVVVLHRTGSATMASLVVGASLVAWLGPGQLLSQFADLYGRRLVMVVSDLVRAVVAAGGFLTGSHAGAVVAIVASGSFYAVLSPANVVVGPLLPSAVRASAFSVLMGVLVVAQSLGASGAGLLADHVSTAHAGALACLPAAVGGVWVLLRRRVPAGFHDDIEAPLRRIELHEELHVDIEARLALIAPHPDPRNGVPVNALRVNDEPLRPLSPQQPDYFLPASPDRTTEYEPEYSPRG
jgi:MFS family permease